MQTLLPDPSEIQTVICLVNPYWLYIDMQNVLPDPVSFSSGHKMSWFIKLQSLSGHKVTFVGVPQVIKKKQ